MSKKIFVTDTILRDAHQSLLATRMRTEDMLPICDKLDKVGYWSLEVWGGATFDACVRFLKEDPWERLRQLRAALPNTRLQMLLRGQNLLGYRHYSDDVVKAFVAKAAVNGIDVFRIFDAMNDVRNLRVAIEAVKAAGKHAQGTIAYTTSPVHTTEAFVAQAKQMEAMGCDSVAIKDMAGLLTPFATGELVKALKAEISLPIFIHSHDTAGLAAMCQLKASKTVPTISTPPSPASRGAPATLAPSRWLQPSKAANTTPASTWRCCRKSVCTSTPCVRSITSLKANSPPSTPACKSTRCRAA
jgi:pyruvate carboxylase subunit B